MAYCNLTDIERALTADLVLRLFDDDKDGQADSSTVDDAIDDARSEINLYVGRVYTVATVEANPPAVLRRLAVTLTIQTAYLRRPEFLNDRGETPYEKRYTRAVKILEDIGAGRVRLDVDDVPERAANVSGAGLYTSTGPADTTDEGFVKDGSGDF